MPRGTRRGRRRATPRRASAPRGRVALASAVVVDRPRSSRCPVRWSVIAPSRGTSTSSSGCVLHAEAVLPELDDVLAAVEELGLVAQRAERVLPRRLELRLRPRRRAPCRRARGAARRGRRASAPSRRTRSTRSARRRSRTSSRGARRPRGCAPRRSSGSARGAAARRGAAAACAPIASFTSSRFCARSAVNSSNSPNLPSSSSSWRSSFESCSSHARACRRARARR